MPMPAPERLRLIQQSHADGRWWIAASALAHAQEQDNHRQLGMTWREYLAAANIAPAQAQRLLDLHRRGVAEMHDTVHYYAEKVARSRGARLAAAAAEAAADVELRQSILDATNAGHKASDIARAAEIPTTRVREIIAPEPAAA